jgi:hypothetical protein
MPKLTGPWIPIAAIGGFFLLLFVAFQVLNLEFFRGDPEQGGSATPIKNEKTALAHAYCTKSAIEGLHLDPERARVLPEYTAWDIGFNRYLVKATVEDANGPGRGKTYLCKVLDQGGSGEENWALQSLEYLN